MSVYGLPSNLGQKTWLRIGLAAARRRITGPRIGAITKRTGEDNGHADQFGNHIRRFTGR